MKSIIIIAILGLAAITSALPLGEDFTSSITTNDLFSQINDILKREINTELNKGDSVEIGDEINKKTGTGHLQVEVHKFTASNGFPVNFKPKDEEILEDKEIVSVVGDFDGSSEYIIKKDSSEESDEKNDSTTTKKVTSVKEESTTLPAKTTANVETTQKKVDTTTESLKQTTTVKSETTKKQESTTTDKTEKLIKDVAEEPVILTQV